MDLSTTYMGLKLENPIVPSASPLSESVDSVKKLEDAGAAAIICYSLFEEQISHESGELDHYLSYGTESYAEATSYFPEPDEFKLTPYEYLDHIANLKKEVKIPVIGSLNGVSTGGWIKYAKNIEDAGADGLELNIYYIPTNPNLTGSEIENMYIDTLTAVKQTVKIPVAVKLSPYFTSMANMARRLDKAGANALVLFNRFYQPDFNLDTLTVEPNLKLSTNVEMRLPLRWISILYGNINASMALTSGVHSSEDIIKVMMAGGDVAQIASNLLLNGTSRVKELLDGVKNWMEEHEYESIQMMKGSMSQKKVGEPAAFERANYMKTLQSYRSLL
ncbi:MAG: dihydroorotate dehydrogenase-like protein [Melioribacteraceae bacterium]|jgi:dihydroorotate dehydrogenase (fumarate)|nr:dihydroorotate dehydrogenase-like protein [Melioribacteraceae bacterium]RJP61048.1 MAG: dihydroorotate dehydrogenase-like protein [Ignavibacteriales bacterium]WKZ68135.1 MAG: dihydroorotate dehydrogenase-like protein [Melioribacteraceae bacterium]